MSGLPCVLAALDWSAWIAAPLTWGILVSALGLLLALPRSTAVRRTSGQIIFLVGLGLIVAGSPVAHSLTSSVVFWLLAAATLVGSAAAVSMRSAVYCAVWFAFSLLGVAGLYLYQGAQFLGVATIVVYAGAIVVTFLFVLMLAQPEGMSSYDRVSWGWFPRVVSPLATGLLVALFTAVLPAAVGPGPLGPRGVPADVLGEAHVARLGGYLFGQHLVSVEVAGTLLLVALVGAIAILMHGSQAPVEEGEA